MVEYDLKQAGTYFLRDEKSIKKFIFISFILAASILLPFLLIFSLIFIIGYCLINTNIRIKNNINSLPEFDIIKIFKVGLKFFGFILAIIVIYALIMSNIFDSSPIFELVFENYTGFFEKLFQGTTFSMGMPTYAGFVLIIMGLLLSVSIFTLPLFLVSGLIYSVELKIGTFLNLDVLKKTFKNFGLIALYVCAILIASILANFINTFILMLLGSLGIGEILIIPIAFVVLQIAYSLLLISDIQAQLIKIIYCCDKGEETNG